MNESTPALATADNFVSSLFLIVCCFLLGPIGLYAVVKQLYSYIMKNVIENEFDLPPVATSRDIVFIGPMAVRCDTWAGGLFLLFTGVDIDLISMCRTRKQHIDADPNVCGDKVIYMEFMWRRVSGLTDESICEDFHALVYYRGIIYQSYRTRRYPLMNLIDAYPPIRVEVSQEDRRLFESETISIDVVKFNHYCAPRSHQEQTGVTIRCTRSVRAVMDPLRSSLKIEL